MAHRQGRHRVVLICTAFVLLMTAPGLALFYGGMVRQRKVLATLLQSFVALPSSHPMGAVRLLARVRSLTMEE